MNTDTERLNYLISSGAYLAWSEDSEVCTVWINNPEAGPEPVQGYPQKCYLDPREAIDAAMRK